jgi:hypothetical protein
VRVAFEDDGQPAAFVAARFSSAVLAPQHGTLAPCSVGASTETPERRLRSGPVLRCRSSGMDSSAVHHARPGLYSSVRAPVSTSIAKPQAAPTSAVVDLTKSREFLSRSVLSAIASAEIPDQNDARLRRWLALSDLERCPDKPIDIAVIPAEHPFLIGLRLRDAAKLGE